MKWLVYDMVFSFSNRIVPEENGTFPSASSGGSTEATEAATDGSDPEGSGTGVR